MKIIYEANDGKRFKTMNECEEYEKKSEDSKKAKEALTLIKEVCSKYDKCKECPFHQNRDCIFEAYCYDIPKNFLNYFEE